MRVAEAAGPLGPTTAARFVELGALDVYVLAVAAMMGLIAVALWIASGITDRVALRLFSLRYALAMLGWALAHPRAMGRPGDVPLVSAFVGIGLTLLTLCALERYVGRLTRKRATALVVAAVAAAGLVTLVLRFLPRDPRPLYLVLAAGMAYGAVAAWQAARHERNVGHGLIAAAFASYPALVLATLAWSPDLPGHELGYVLALPAIVIGIAVLVASLVRFGHRLEAELARREAAERAVRELNAGLEHRIAERTAELHLIVDGLEGFARSVSHDLRGPLTGLAGLARMAREALARGEVARAGTLLEPIATQADRLVDLVNDLAALTRLQEQPPKRERRPMRPIVDEAVAQLALAPDTAAMLQQVELRVDELPAASVDAGLMRQVFVNLLGNALRFATQAAERGAAAARAAPSVPGPLPAAPTVHVGAATEGDTVSFFVEDSGPGFPPERAGELFRPFARMHAEGLSRNGIGLSIVRHIVEAHGGKVWAESRPGQGATFGFAVEGADGR
ncbi:MAG: HAMP domain-containing histidine kinase [Burkholderiales bacterium]|nr:HAMP domain-containing histidine kinase [Burkholderiales bacterium]